MKKYFLWDLDGTLLDSYDAIVGSLFEFYQNVCNVNVTKDFIYKSCIDKSAREFINEMNEKYHLSFEKDKEKYSKISHSKLDDIKLFDDTIEVLQKLNKKGCVNFIVTHRGESTNYLVDKFDIRKYFAEVITNKSGFDRKPSAESANFIINKYKINRKDAYYVGDRNIDMIFAKNAGIKGILFISNKCNANVQGNEDFVIYSLKDILKIIK